MKGMYTGLRFTKNSQHGTVQVKVCPGEGGEGTGELTTWKAQK